MVREPRRREKKKLTGAAEYWFRGAGPSDGLQNDAEAYGVILPEKLTAPVDYEVFPENWDAVLLFLRCQTQWRAGAEGSVLGLDYGPVFQMMALYAVESQRDVMDGVQVIEAKAAELINEQARKAAKRANR